MRHRTHDQLFAAAGVTAALSLIGTGVTVLKGSVFQFDRWPDVAGDLARRVQLPVAPLTQTERRKDAERRSLFASVLQADGTVVVPGLGTGDGITSVGLSINGAGTTASRADAVATGTTSSAGVTLDGYAGSLGSAPSSSVDGMGDTASPGTTGGTRVASTAVDTDGDGVPDTWQSDHGTPAAGTTDTPVTPNTTSSGRDAAGSAFRADPPADEPVTEPTPAPTPVPVPPDTTTPTTPEGPATTPEQPAPTDAATTPPEATTPADSAPPADPAPAEPAPPADPAPSDPAPPADPAPAAPAAPVETAPADPAPPADPPPAAAPTPAPVAAPAPADPQPAAPQSAPADDASAANAAIPSSAR
ncbi:MAG TPA: hypothetical protein VK501_05225 [Baekduia sp.]|uniref:hypothetical protein n=1 Tax=Baekduia sp. TaxID=2600305 RepID=UPI002CB4775A|nr:hypothetical protein [Baekduia sp.]HMJ33300.1 hypothetical protein [Baekduia sp.]